jgi:exopolysaccharide biosynthesis predicted pyruvyltransferase EpsI
MFKTQLKRSLVGEFLRKIYRLCLSLFFYIKFRRYKFVKKIIYVLTPSANLRNVGDHAQAAAIRAWLEDNFKEHVILEFNKDEVYRYISSIEKVVHSNDIFFLHSGGNLGDRGLWSENARRSIIKSFPDNKIISLPQTIFFSNTPKGKKELELSKEIYNNHRDLTIMARDEQSFVLAKEFFPQCRVMLFPDFVLYAQLDILPLQEREKILLCLRKDNESVTDESMKRNLVEEIKKRGYGYNEFDTTLDRNIPNRSRLKELQKALTFFKTHKLVFTDRFHGVIFSVMTHTPCIALKTVDHKLRESVKWFQELNYVFYLENFNQLSETIDKALHVLPQGAIEWRARYFDSLKDKIFNKYK